WKANWLPGMTQIGVSDEVFYDFDAERISANWFVPLKLSFKPSKYFSCAFAYRLTSANRGDGDWTHTHVWEFSGSLSL
ncbi:MAG: hypothetical protein AAF212_05185, partial [Verrucomicrobiota bacterium]